MIAAEALSMRVLTRRTVTVLAAALGIRAATAQSIDNVPPSPPPEPGNATLPNGKRQRDEILKAEYEQNLKEARELSALARSFELDLEKSDRFVLSLGLLKKLDDIEKLSRKIRTRMRR